MSRPKVFSAELELQQEPNKQGLQRILDYYPKEEQHFFYGGIIRITQGKVSHLLHLSDLPASIRQRPTLTYAPQDAMERRLFKYEKRLQDISYVTTEKSEELLFHLAKQGSIEERGEVISSFYKETTHHKIQNVLSGVKEYLRTIF